MAVAHVFIDYANGNDAAGDGSLGNPWQTIQHAQDNAVRGSNGTQFNCRSNAPHPVSPGLNLATYIANNGALSSTYQIAYRGYENAADDGGRATLAIGGNHQLFAATNYNYVNLTDLNVQESGTFFVTTVQLGAYAQLVRCVVSGRGGSGRIVTGVGPTILGCYVFSIGAGTSGTSISVGAPSVVSGCYVDGRGTGTGIVGSAGSGGNMITNNIIRQQASGTGISVPGWGLVANNTIWSNYGNGRGIQSISASRVHVLNNLIANFSSGTGIYLTGPGSVVINNATYNCMTPYDLSGLPTLEFGNVVLDDNPFVDAENGNFSINGNVAGVTEAAWPQSWPGLVTDMASLADVGAVQAGAGEGGGGGLMYPIIGASFIRGAA